MNELQTQVNRLMMGYTAGGATAHRKLQKSRLDTYVRFLIRHGVRSLNDLSYNQFDLFLKESGLRMKTELEYARVIEKLLLAIPVLSETDRKFLMKLRERKKFFTEKIKNNP